MPAAPKVDVDAETEPKAEVKADPGLAKLYQTWQTREAANNKLFVQIVDYVKTQKISRSVVRKTLESRGLSPSSVASEVSRIMGLAKAENAPILQKLMEDEITIAAARKAIAKPQERPEKSPADKLWEKLYVAAGFAFKASHDDPLFTLKYFVEEATNAWNTVKDEYAEKEKEAAEAAEAGEEEVTEEEEAVEVE
jgi:hypothetical protein